MCSVDDVLASLDDPQHLASLLKQNPQLILPDSAYSQVATHFLARPVSVDGLSALRNLYGRPRSSSLNEHELSLLAFNVKQCLTTKSSELIKPLLQYLHNANRLLPSEFRDMAYLCATICLSSGNKNIIACILCAFLEQNTPVDVRFDLIINGLYETEDEDEDNPWLDQLTKILIERDQQWLRKYYLEKRFGQELLHAIDQHDTDNILKITITTEADDQRTLSSTIAGLEHRTDIEELHHQLSTYVKNSLSMETITESSLYHLFAASTIYPHDLHPLFACSLLSIIDPSNYSVISLRLFRRVTHLLNNYYINQQDLLDDNRYRLVNVFLLCKLLCEVHRRRSQSEHPWYQLYKDVPQEHPLPTFDLFTDLLCLLATLCYAQLECQKQVQLVPGTIEAVLSMMQIDLNQPKSQASVTWVLKCLTEFNEEIREYIKQIK